MEKNKKSHGNDNFRSVEVRKIMENIPSTLIVLGYVITISFFVIMILVIVFTPYPYENGETILRHLCR